MKKRIILTFCGLIFLTVVLFIGTPFEFLDSSLERISTFFIIALILLLFILLFRQILQFESKVLKRIALVLISILGIPYLLIGIWTIILYTSSNPAMWQDTLIYTNRNGEKVISQWRETSGSIYDYRDRKILVDFGQFRISLNCKKENLKGIWTEFNVGKKSTSTINFDK